MQGIGLTSGASVELISAYCAKADAILAVPSTPGWYVVGAFFLSVDVEDAQLELVGMVSDPSLTMTVRLFDTKDAVPIDASMTSLAGQSDARAVSGLISVLSGQRVYQIQAQVTGGAGVTLFGSLKSATLLQQ